MVKKPVSGNLTYNPRVTIALHVSICLCKTSVCFIHKCHTLAFLKTKWCSIVAILSSSHHTVDIQTRNRIPRSNTLHFTSSSNLTKMVSLPWNELRIDSNVRTAASQMFFGGELASQLSDRRSGSLPLPFPFQMVREGERRKRALICMQRSGVTAAASPFSYQYLASLCLFSVW